jgi:hypothetical protein
MNTHKLTNSQTEKKGDLSPSSSSQKSCKKEATQALKNPKNHNLFCNFQSSPFLPFFSFFKKLFWVVSLRVFLGEDQINYL